jgi:hypothetical protein
VLGFLLFSFLICSYRDQQHSISTEGSSGHNGEVGGTQGRPTTRLQASRCGCGDGKGRGGGRAKEVPQACEGTKRQCRQRERRSRVRAGCNWLDARPADRH